MVSTNVRAITARLHDTVDDDGDDGEHGFVVFCLGGWSASAIVSLVTGQWLVALPILLMIAFLVALASS